MKVNNRLLEFRQSAGLTQLGLAERSGVPWRTIQDQERGLWKSPTFATARKIARVLGKQVDEIWPGEGE